MQGGQAIDLALPVGFLREREVGGVRQGFGEGGVPVAGELRQQLVADAVAGEIQRGVGGVFAPGDAAGRARKRTISARSTSISGRTMPSGVTGRMAASPVAPAAAQEAKEHGFGLVGARVAQGDARRKSASELVAEERKPRVAGGFLQIARGGGEIEFVERERAVQASAASARTNSASPREASPRRL